MVNIVRLIQHIRNDQAGRSASPAASHGAALVAFHNYLSHLFNPEDLLPSDRDEAKQLIDGFFERNLSHAHWLAHSQELAEAIHQCLLDFTEALDAHDRADMRALLIRSEAWSKQDIQAVEIQSEKNFQLLLDDQLELESEEAEAGHRFCRLEAAAKERIGSKPKAVILTQLVDSRVWIREFLGVALIENGVMRTLSPVSSLVYDSNLQLQLNHHQEFDLGENQRCWFVISPQQLHGKILRGYTHQLMFDLDGQTLQRFPQLFYSLKRLEQHFIDRQSDPLYLELIRVIEHAAQLAELRSAEGLEFARDTLKRARLAQEKIYGYDRVLGLLIDNLEKTLALNQKSAQLATGLEAPEDIQRQLKGWALAPLKPLASEVPQPKTQQEKQRQQQATEGRNHVKKRPNEPTYSA